jgi:hypothetical protein
MPHPRLRSRCNAMFRRACRLGTRALLLSPARSSQLEFPRFSGHLTACAVLARKDGVCAEDPTRLSGAVPPRGD